MTEVTPALRSCGTTRGAWVSVLAVWVGSEAMVSTTGVTPARLRSGNRYCFRATWSEARSPAITPTFFPASRPELSPQWTTAWSTVAWSGPVHHRYGDPLLVQLVTVIHWPI